MSDPHMRSSDQQSLSGLLEARKPDPSQTRQSQRLRAAGIVLILFLVAALCLVTWRPLNFAGQMTESGLVVVSSLTCVVALYLWKKQALFWWLRTICASIILARGLSAGLAIAERGLGLALLIALGTGIALGFIIGIVNQKGARQVALATLFPIGFLVTASWVSSQATRASLAQTIELGVLSFALPLLIPIGGYWWDSLIRDERRLDSRENRQELQGSFWVTWVSLVLAFIATVTASLALEQAAGLESRVPANIVVYASLHRSMVIGLSGAMELVILGALLSRAPVVEQLPSWPQEPRLSVRSKVTGLLVVAALTWMITPWAATFLASGNLLPFAPYHYRTLFYVFGVVNAVWLGIAVIRNITGNVASLEFYRLSWKGWLIALTWGCAITSNWAWLWVVGSWSSGGWAPLTAFAENTAVVYLGGLGLLVMCTWALTRATPRPATQPVYRYMMVHHPAQMVFHEHILQAGSVVATLFAVFIGDQVAASAQSWGVADAAWMDIALIIAPVLIVLVPLFLLVSKNVGRAFEWEDSRMTSTIVARANGNPELANALNKERVKRLRARSRVFFLFTFVLSPVGLVASLWQMLYSAIGPSDSDAN